MKNIYKALVDIVKNKSLEMIDKKMYEDFFEESNKITKDEENSISSAYSEEEFEETEKSIIYNNNTDNDYRDKVNDNRRY